MAPITLGYAVLMIALGLITYFATGAKSVTALIPTFFGLAFLLCGVLALKEQLRKHAMHAASALGLIAFMAAVAVLTIRGSTGAAAVEQGIMAALSLAFVVLCVRSFIMARRARTQQPNV